MRISLRPPRREACAELLSLLSAPELAGARVEGETGVGKSTLLERATEQLRARTGRVVGAVRLETREESPLLPWAAALGDALAHAGMDEDGLAAALTPLETPLRHRAELLGRWCLAVGGAPGPGRPGTWRRLSGRLDVLEALSKLVVESPGELVRSWRLLVLHVARAMQRQRPEFRLILVFDQLERAGRFTRSMIESLVGLPTELVGLLVSWNDVQGGGLPCPASIRGLPCLELVPMGTEELLETLQQWRGGVGATAPDAPRLLERTGGNPLALRMLSLAERFGQAFDAEQPFAPGVLSPLLASLAEPARVLLSLLAVLPNPLSLEAAELAVLLKIDVPSVEPYLQSLRASGLLSGPSWRPVLAHTRFRAAIASLLEPEVLRHLGGLWVRFLSAQQARALEHGVMLPAFGAYLRGLELSASPERWLEIKGDLVSEWFLVREWEMAARHVEALLLHRSRLEPAQRATALFLSGVVALERGRDDAAIPVLEDARQQLVGQETGALLQQIEETLTWASLQRGDLVGALTRARELERAGRKRNLPAAAARAERLMALIQLKLGEVHLARATLQRVVRALEAQDDGVEAGRVCWELGELDLAGGEAATGLDFLARAERLLREQAASAEELGSLSGRRALALELVGEPERARECWVAGLERCRIERLRGDGQAELAWCILANDFGSFLYRGGNLTEAVQVLDAALERARWLGEVRLEASILMHLGLVRSACADRTGALEAARRAQHLLTLLGDVRGLAVATNHLGVLLFEMGHLEQAQSAFRESLATWRSLSDAVSEAIALGNLALVYSRLGDEARAYDAARDCLKLRESLEDLEGQRSVLLSMITVLEQHQRLGRAEMALRQLIALDGHLGHPQLQAELGYLQDLQLRLARQELAESPS